jgi:hypothetical protein
MLSNAKDLYEGRTPYQEIFIQYGIGSTLIHTTAYALNHSLLSIIIITVVFYITGLALIYRIAALVTSDAQLSVLIFVTYIFSHPIVIYPWPNYLAFPFILFGLFNLLKPECGYLRAFSAGLLFGAAVLVREGLLLSLALIVAIYYLYDLYLSADVGKASKRFCSCMAGVLIPILFFLLYLWAKGLIVYWIIYAWDLPKIYLQWYPHMTGVHVLDKLAQMIGFGVKSLNITWLLIGASLLCSVGFIVVALFKRTAVNVGVAKIAIASLALMLSALHIPDVFRLMTGSFIAVIVFYYVAKKIKIDKVIFFISIILLIYSIPNELSGNYFAPKMSTIQNAQHVNTPTVFKHQLWTAEVEKYYTEISNDLQTLKNVQCGLKYHANNTMDTFLHVLSPFKNYLITPYVTVEEMLPLRLDIKPIREKWKDNDLIILQMVPILETDVFHPPPGYFLYREYTTPITVFVPTDQILQVYVPESCRNRIRANLKNS